MVRRASWSGYGRKSVACVPADVLLVQNHPACRVARQSFPLPLPRPLPFPFPPPLPFPLFPPFPLPPPFPPPPPSPSASSSPSCGGAVCVAPGALGRSLDPPAPVSGPWVEITAAPTPIAIAPATRSPASAGAGRRLPGWDRRTRAFAGAATGGAATAGAGTAGAARVGGGAAGEATGCDATGRAAGGWGTARARAGVAPSSGSGRPSTAAAAAASSAESYSCVSSSAVPVPRLPRATPVMSPSVGRA